MGLSTAERNTRTILLSAAAGAYGYRQTASDEPNCECGHGQSAHYGVDGEKHCGETDCGCSAFA